MTGIGWIADWQLAAFAVISWNGKNRVARRQAAFGLNR